MDLDAAPWVGADRRYSYDDAGTITRIADLTPDPDGAQCFGYDYLRRLTQAWTPSSGDCATAPSNAALGGPAPYWHSWTYDVVGNRLTQVVHAAGGDATAAYSYPSPGGVRPHALTSVSTTGPGGSSVDGYGYDNMGNTTSRPGPAGAQGLSWDAQARLATTSDPSGSTSYLYDGDGGRLISRDPAGKTLYLPGQELRYTTATATTACTRYYTHNATTIASRTAAGLTWLAADHQGTQSIAIEQATLTVTQRRQTPFGAPRGGTPSWPNPHGFVGGVTDPTGLTHLGARQYDPAIGRFISDDPITEHTDPQQANGYSYANNTPISMSDPDGLRPFCDEGGNFVCSIPPLVQRNPHPTPTPSPAYPGGTPSSGGDCTTRTVEYCHTPGSNRKGSYDLGWQWLGNMLAGCPAGHSPTMSCVTVEYFRDGDPFTEAIRQIDHLAYARVIIAAALANGDTNGTVHNWYSDKSPLQRAAQAAGDFVSIPTGGAIGTRDPQQFLGSFDLEWSVIGRSGNGVAIVEFHLTNASTANSANPSWVKLTAYPEGSAGDGHDAAPGEHWLQQSVRWREPIAPAVFPSPAPGPPPMPPR